MVRKFMVNFAKRYDGVVRSALTVAVGVMENLVWRMAIRISAFPMCLSDDFAFFIDGDVAAGITSFLHR